jgi:hypothetical protein
MLFGGNKFHVAAPISAFANANLPEAIPLGLRRSAIAFQRKKGFDASLGFSARIARTAAGGRPR